MHDERIDEALELLWLLEEEGHSELRRFHLNSDDPDNAGLTEQLLKKGLVETGRDSIALTDSGRMLARKLVRRHRLAERLFMEVFDLPEDKVEEDACRMEHILSEELTDSVCTFLGHPPTCPHGKPIPRGDCCRKYSVDVKPVVVRLNDFEVGKSGRIVFITPSDASRISRLSSIGVIPGTVIRLMQKRPSLVLQVDETTIAIDPELGREIFVKIV